MTLVWLSITMLVIFVLVTILVEMKPKYRVRWVLWAAMGAYILFAVILYETNPGDVVNDSTKSLIQILLIGGFFICFILYRVLIPLDDAWADSDNPYLTNLHTRRTAIMTVLKFLFLVSIVGALAYLIIPWCVKLMMGSSSVWGHIQTVLLFMVIVGILVGVLYYMTQHASFSYYSTSNLILKGILYVPCLVGEHVKKWVQFIRYDMKREPKTTWMILLGELVLIAGSIFYFSSNIQSIVDTPQNGIMLQDDAVYLDERTVVGNYDNLNQGKNGFLYNYAISCWFWINPQPPSQSASTTVYTSILNYGNTPNITYMGAQNTLRITMKDQDHKIELMDDLVNIPLQRWNHLVVNYSGGTLDVFLNGNLERTVTEVIPFKSTEPVTIGTDDGVQGGICKVVYLQTAIDIAEITKLYNNAPSGFVRKGWLSKGWKNAQNSIKV